MSHATVDRREFLKTGAAAGATLLIGLYLPAFDPRPRPRPPPAHPPEPVKPNAWIQLGPAGPAAQAPPRVSAAAAPDAGTGPTGQGQRHGRLRHGRARARNAVRRGGALPRVRRTREGVRPRPCPRRAGRATRGPSLERRRG